MSNTGITSTVQLSPWAVTTPGPNVNALQQLGFCMVQYKTSEVRSKCSSLMRVNLYKDQIKTSDHMPPLPNDKRLHASLRPAYNVLRAAGQERRGGRPMYAISEEQKKAADVFLQVTLLSASNLPCWVPNM